MTQGRGRASGTTIDLIRHADVHNPDDLFYGRLPRFRLSELGRRQAAATAALLAEAPLAAVYTSPLLRARQTAAIIAAAHPARPPVIELLRLLIEVLSHWQGRPTTDLDAIDFDFYAHARDGDESISAVFDRIERLVRRLLRRFAGQHVACVSHADPIAIARAGFAEMPLVSASIRGQPEYPAKGSITRLIFADPDDRPVIRYLAM